MPANINSVSLGVSPGLIRVDELNPGEIFEGEFAIVSSSLDGETQSYAVSAAPLTFENSNYDLSFSERDDYNQIVDWIEIENPTGEVNPQERLAIKFKIKVPEDAPAGGQYASFLVSPNYTANAAPSGISVENRSRVAVLLYATINGETREEGTVLENNVSAFFFDRPIKVTSLVENTGNVHLPITYTLRIYPLFSNEELYTNEEHLEEKLVIPDTELYQEKTWDNTPLLGIFRVEQEIDFGDKYNVKETVALVAPTWFVILALFFLVSIFYSLIDHAKKRRAETEEKVPKRS